MSGGQGEVVETVSIKLYCTRCRRRYPIDSGLINPEKPMCPVCRIPLRTKSRKNRRNLKRVAVEP